MRPAGRLLSKSAVEDTSGFYLGTFVPSYKWARSSPTGYSFGAPQVDQYAPQVPPPPAAPGSAPLGFAPATTPTQDMSKAPTGQPDFPYSQYGKNSTRQFIPSPFESTLDVLLYGGHKMLCINK